MCNAAADYCASLIRLRWGSDHRPPIDAATRQKSEMPAQTLSAHDGLVVSKPAPVDADRPVSRRTLGRTDQPGGRGHDWRPRLGVPENRPSSPDPPAATGIAALSPLARKSESSSKCWGALSNSARSCTWPLRDMATRAIELVQERRRHDTPAEERIELLCTLVVRGSTRPP